ncbi:MAG: hypothetical protein ACE5H3_00075 [Planctomycetota bacterium]
MVLNLTPSVLRRFPAGTLLRFTALLDSAVPGKPEDATDAVEVTITP